MCHNDHDDLQGNQIGEVGNLERGDDFGDGIFSYILNSKHREVIGLGVITKHDKLNLLKFCLDRV